MDRRQQKNVRIGRTEPDFEKCSYPKKLKGPPHRAAFYRTFP